MLTIRFPSGLAVTYNAATYADHLPGGLTRLSVGKGGPWVADVFTGAGGIVEAQSPCVVSMAGPTTVQGAAKLLVERADDLRRLSYSDAGDLAAVKRLLRKFHTTQRTWTR